MDVDGSASSQSPCKNLPEFTTAEIREMENVFRGMREASLEKECCLEIATSFSCSRSSTVKPTITWQQVQNWFQNKQKDLQAIATSSHAPDEMMCVSLDTPYHKVEPENQDQDNGKSGADFTELAYEVKSTKDNAWYDVAKIMNFRPMKNSSELEVLVRYAGFGREEDEWVALKKQVRERSIPLEPNECHMVKVGDLVMSFRQRKKAARYFDAHVVEIERKAHDENDCKCIFVVQYDHDSKREEVTWEKLCRRPERTSSGSNQ